MKDFYDLFQEKKRLYEEVYGKEKPEPKYRKAPMTDAHKTMLRTRKEELKKYGIFKYIFH